MKKNPLAARRGGLAAIIALALLLVAARVFAQTGDPLTDLLRSLGPIGIFLEFVKAMGLPGAIVIIWYFDRRDTQAILLKYKDDMDEMREMYKSNVRLVEDTQKIGDNYCELSKDLKDIIVMNTQSNMLLQAELKGRKNGRKRA